jgi:hypothetical protein
MKQDTTVLTRSLLVLDADFNELGIENEQTALISMK